MLRHIVMFRFAEGQPEADKVVAVQALEALAGQVPEIRSLTVATGVPGNPAACDLVLVADFEGEAEFRRYGEHEAHVHAWKSVVQPLVSDVATIQYHREGEP